MYEELSKQEICDSIAATVENIQKLRKQLSLVSSLVPEAPEADEETPHFCLKKNGLVSFADAVDSERSSN